MPLKQHSRQRKDVVIIGAGFYGSALAIYLARQHGLRKILLVDSEPAILTRASFNNQARIHNGYHYPRSLTTAYRSQVSLPLFLRDWPDAVTRDFTKLYAIARQNSKVTARQFERFCRAIDVRLEPADSDLNNLFEPRLIEKVFLAEEYAFDAAQLAGLALTELQQCGIDIELETTATAISNGKTSDLMTDLRSKDGVVRTVKSRYVFNCTYSALNHLGGDFPGTNTRLKQQITELALIEVPSPLAGLGITVMDGPFFSLMPFPPRKLHSLSHVRYTPHVKWNDQRDIDPGHKLKQYDRTSQFDRMMRDASRYLPALLDAKYDSSLFEVKTLLAANEIDDGRPILFAKHPELPGCYSILGGKIDNIYDVLETLNAEQFS